MNPTQQLAIALGRLRACWHKLLGTQIARKVTFGRGVRFNFRQHVVLSERVTLEDDVWFKLVTANSKVRIGSYTFIGRGTEIDVSESVTIGDHVLIGPGVFITDHNHNIAAGHRIDEQGCSPSSIVIGNDVWLGAHVVVLPGVKIGTGAVVGAGAVVTKDLPEYSVSVGIPARVVRQRTKLG